MTVELGHHAATSGGHTVVQAKRDRLPRCGLALASILLVEDEVRAGLGNLHRAISGVSA